MVPSRDISEKSPSCASTLRGRLRRAWRLSCPGVGLERGAGRRGGCLCGEAEAVNSSLETRLSVSLGQCQPKCPFCLSMASSTPWRLSLCILSTSPTSSWTLLCWAHAVSSGFRSHWVLALPAWGCLSPSVIAVLGPILSFVLASFIPKTCWAPGGTKLFLSLFILHRWHRIIWAVHAQRY